MFAATLLHMQPEDTSYRGDRDPQKLEKTLWYLEFKNFKIRHI